MANAKDKLIACCKQHDVMCLDAGNVVRIDAPIGKIFKTTGNHSHDCYTEPGLVTKAMVWQGLLDDAKDGLEDCTDADCDSCIHDPCTFEAIQRLYGGERLA